MSTTSFALYFWQHNYFNFKITLVVLIDRYAVNHICSNEVQTQDISSVQLCFSPTLTSVCWLVGFLFEKSFSYRKKKEEEEVRRRRRGGGGKRRKKEKEEKEKRRRRGRRGKRETTSRKKRRERETTYNLFILWF